MINKYLYGLIISLMFCGILNTAYSHGITGGSGLISPPDFISSGGITSGANLTDNALIRGDGGAKAIQDSGIFIDDSDNVSGIGNITGTAGQMTITGGTGSGDDLILQSTSNATKGSIFLAASVVTGTSHLLKRFITTITLDTGDAETDVGLTAGAVIMSAAIRVAGQITGLDSADHHIQLGINGVSNKYIDVAKGASQTTIDVNVKDSYTFDTTVALESAALVLTITGGGDNIPSGGSVEVEIMYLASANLPDI